MSRKLVTRRVTAPAALGRTSQDITKVVDATLQTKPAGATHWSCRTMAKAQGVSKATINRVWQGHHLQPHRTKKFKTLPGPKISGEADQRAGTLSQSAREGAGAVRG
jgi:hypothetical protein